MINDITSSYNSDKPSADGGSMSLVNTCTENGVSAGADETRVNDIKPSDSTALLASFRNRTAIITYKSIFRSTMM